MNPPNLSRSMSRPCSPFFGQALGVLLLFAIFSLFAGVVTYLTPTAGLVSEDSVSSIDRSASAEVLRKGSEVLVQDAQQLREAVSRAQPGTRVALAAGEYPGGFYFSNLRGSAKQPIVIRAADPAHPPVISGGREGLHLSNPAFVELHHLAFIGASGNGLNIDDGGSFDAPAHHLVLRGLTVKEVGPEGNRDGIKLSGVSDFRVESCAIERWGTGGGSGIDMVGCHRGVISSNLFRHTDTGGSTGVQCKGGTGQIVIRRNRFENAGGRAVNIGGSTGLQFFRPPLSSEAEHSEAKEIVVEGNTFVGGGTPVAFVGVDGAVFRFNTIFRPKRWALRILQETRAPGFVPSRNGEFTDNIVVFHSGEWGEGGVNIGPSTAAPTFKFARNWWYCSDQPAQSQPRLPAVEADGVYGRAPQFLNEATGDLRLQPDSPARKVGADALPE